MNKTEKKRFIRELISSTQQRILENVTEMPEQWDGIELRQYIAEKFLYASLFTPNEIRLRPHLKRRKKDYENEVITRNL